MAEEEELKKKGTMIFERKSSEKKYIYCISVIIKMITIRV